MKLISFRMLKKHCVHNDGIHCWNAEGNTSDDKCYQKNCPVWKSLDPGIRRPRVIR